MRTANLLFLHPHRAHLAEFILVSAIALIQGCAANAPSCDGRFEPINMPASMDAGRAEERPTSEQEDAS